MIIERPLGLVGVVGELTGDLDAFFAADAGDRRHAGVPGTLASS
jgi:hypothetical protein